MQQAHAFATLGCQDARDFQALRPGLPQDGVLGPETYAALVAALREHLAATLPSPAEYVCRIVAAATGAARRRLLRLRDSAVLTDAIYQPAVNPETPEVQAARNLAAEAAGKLRLSPAFQRLGAATQTAILRDLGTIRSVLNPAPASPARGTRSPLRWKRRTTCGAASLPAAANSRRAAEPAPATPPAAPRKAATETLAQRTGALIDEVDFPGFVAGLINGTFDAMVDASIRQMEAFADLVGAVAKNAEDFTRENVSANQARDWLAKQYPRDVVLDASSLDTGEPVLRVRSRGGEDEAPPSPDWLADFDLAGEELTDELLEEQLIPAARRRVGESRLQTLATMVLLGMNRIVVRDGSISARVRFRAAANGQDQCGLCGFAGSGRRDVGPARVGDLRHAHHDDLDGRRQRADRPEPQGGALRRSENQFCQRDAAARSLRRRSGRRAAATPRAAVERAAPSPPRPPAIPPAAGRAAAHRARARGAAGRPVSAAARRRSLSHAPPTRRHLDRARRSSVVPADERRSVAADHAASFIDVPIEIRLEQSGGRVGTARGPAAVALADRARGTAAGGCD